MNARTMWRVRALAARAAVAREGFSRTISLRHDAEEAARVVVHVAHPHRRSGAMGLLAARRAGFTLIELLVVIAIIALLVSIMVMADSSPYFDPATGLRNSQATARARPPPRIPT